MTASKKLIYKTDNFSLFEILVPVKLLETDLGTFTTIEGNFIGKVVLGYKDKGFKIKVKHQQVIQHFPDGSSCSWTFDPERGYICE